LVLKCLVNPLCSEGEELVNFTSLGGCTVVFTLLAVISEIVERQTNRQKRLCQAHEDTVIIASKDVRLHYITVIL